ncbi:MAG: hypothetical protein ACFFBP_06990 [Promethearchaeota archaeon]
MGIYPKSLNLFRLECLSISFSVKGCEKNTPQLYPISSNVNRDQSLMMGYNHHLSPFNQFFCKDGFIG